MTAAGRAFAFDRTATERLLAEHRSENRCPDLGAWIRDAADVLQDALAEIDQLTETRERHLILIAKLTRETPYPAELEECRSARAALLAEIGSLRSRIAKLATDRAPGDRR